MMANNLQKGWVECSIGEILLAKKGKKPSTTIDEPKVGYIPYILIDEMEGKPIRAYTNDPKVSIVDESEVLLVWDGSIGKCGSGLNGAIGSTLVSLKTLGNIPTKFLEYTIRQQNNFIKETSTGTGLQHINKDFFKLCKILLPPLPEQQRIVAKLDALMLKVESNKQHLNKIPKLLERFRQSVLAAAVSGRLTENWRNNAHYDLETDLPLSWQLVKIDKLINSVKKDLRTGPFGTALKKNEHKQSGIPVWGIESIGKNGSFTRYNKIFVTVEKAKDLKSFEVKGGNIIISRSGTVGEICILPDDVEYGLISTNLMKIVLNNEIILSKYFCWLFDGSQLVIDKLRELCTGSTRIFLTQTILKEIEYPLPPFEEQKEIIKKVSELFEFANKLENRYTKANILLDKLPQSILAKTFRGELVPQNPNDEPASVLLERIKFEREKLESSKNVKHKKSFKTK